MTSALRRDSFQTSTDTISIKSVDTRSAVDLANWWPIEKALRGMAEAGFAYHATKDKWYLSEAQARLRRYGEPLVANSCKLDPTQARLVVWFAALAYDMTKDGLTTEDRNIVFALAKTCAQASLLAEVDALKKDPTNGTAFNTLGKFIGAATLLAGDLPEARQWLNSALPTYLTAINPYGGSKGIDGGYGNGTSYALWDTGDSLIAWDAVERILGLRMYSHPWIANFHRYVAYTLPPGSPAGLFGDGAEEKRTELWARLGKAVMSRNQTPLALWWAGQMKGEDTARLDVLLSPRTPTTSAAWPSTELHGQAFPAIGWAAMHSSLNDTNRASVYFKSSPLGSYNHSHADQNSLVIHKAGQQVLTTSGVYDAYGSPHWVNWYKTTAAHNAITFDGGKGQPLGPLNRGLITASGAIKRFERGPNWYITSGDATAAYAPSLSTAQRTVVFVGGRYVFVLDSLAASTAKKFELNFHTMGQPGSQNSGIVIAGSSCLKTYSNTNIVPTTNKVIAPAPQGIIWDPNWVTRYGATEATTNFAAVTVIDLDCTSQSTVKPTFSAGMWTIKTPSNTVYFTETTHNVSVK
ncbi:heparinase II/III domain-containing protein [Roseateles albus]|uniref:Heparinase II/III family protein n=1 Tax=Roseateles albus TaxID=2987525 RepID=A0ABT5KKG9_9BURK|nr:heparinase II/III family protein [Roseateles albus]MDC8774427.1 heparinase II/III family protein [Roseateles albus]